MHTLTPSRRLPAAVLAVVLTAGGLLAAAPPAEAAVLGMTVAGGSISFDDDPTGTTCTHSGPGFVSSEPSGQQFAANGVPVTSTVSASDVVTDTGNSSDTTTLTGSVTSTVTATGVAGQLTHIHMVANATSSLTTAIAGSKCGASVFGGAGAQFQFDLAAPTLVTVTAESHRLAGTVQIGNLLSPDEDIDGVALYSLGSHGTSTATSLLQAGTGLIGLSQVQFGLEAPATAGTRSTSGDLGLDITFETPGVASTTQSGSAGKYVTLAAGRNCAAGTLPLTWTKKAGKGKQRAVKKAIVKVNGAKVATIRKPKKNEVSLIKGLNAEREADVEVSFKIQGKGKLTVDRSYLRCT